MVLRKNPVAGRNDDKELNTPSSTKSQEAAQEALMLGTRGSWGERVAHTPASTVADDYDIQDEHDVPPPTYSDSMASSAYGAARDSAPVGVPAPVRDPALVENEPFLPSTSQHADEESGTEADVPSNKPRDEQPLLPMRSHDRRAKRRRFRIAIIFVLVNLLNLSLIYHFVIKGSGHQVSNKPRPTITPGPSESPWPIQREYRQHETSQSISGTYTLYDLLELSTTSGSISITLNIEPGTKPAVLRLSSASGSINVNIRDLSTSPGASRTFDTIAESKSGSISGSIPHGNGGSTILRTKSGSMGVSILTSGVDNDSKLSTILTESGNGSQSIRFVQPKGRQITMVQAKHIVHGSSSINLQYGGSWLGKLHAKSFGSGSVSVNGQGMQYNQRGNREVFAWRGQGDLQAVEAIGEGSGSISFNGS